MIAASSEVAASMNLVCVPIVFQPRHGFVPVAAESFCPALARGKRRRASRFSHQLEQFGLIDLVRNARRHFERYVSSMQSGLQRFSKSRLQFNADDVVLLLDSSWTTSYWKCVRQAQQAGAVVGAAVYDLLPIQLPDSMTVNQRESFLRWWTRAYEEVDYIAAISQSVHLDAIDFHKRYGTRLKPLIGGEFALGADLTLPQSDVRIRQSLLDLINGEQHAASIPFYLNVGTFSPRKQQALVLDAFDELWKRGRRAGLVFVGGGGWHSEQFIRRLQSHPRFGSTLFWFSDLNDAELDWCYRHASGLVAASLGEGFDLPVVEALRRKCRVFASDIPVHHEVAGGFATYFSVGNRDCLMGLLERHLVQGKREDAVHLKDFAWPNWQESCEDLLRLIVRLSRECKEFQLAKRSYAA